MIKKAAKKLVATTDYWDNIIGQDRLFSRQHLDSLHRYLGAIGVSRHQWMYNPAYTFYDDRTTGFDLVREAAASAHAHGLEFFAVIKPFEGGGSGNPFPHTMPAPGGAKVINDLRGMYPMVRPFVAEHPQLCLQRRSVTGRPPGPVSAIRLVKQNDKQTRVKQEHLSIWTSDKNNGFARYDGPYTFRETVEWRPGFPKSGFCRILHLQGLQLNPDQKYILVRCSLADGSGDFTNERGCLVELADGQGAAIPFIISTGSPDLKSVMEQYKQNRWQEIFPYFAFPETRNVFADVNELKKHYHDFFTFDERIKLTEQHTLDKIGYVAVACGKPENLVGNLHPIYPEVRQHWLDMVRYCLERDVDGINIRTSNHSRSPEAWEYGFNEPVIKASGGQTDYPTIRRINGDAYTLFLRKARDLIKSYGKSMTVHLYSQMLIPDDRITQLNYIPPNFDWQWQTWIREIADDLEFRGAWTLRPWNLRQALETFYDVTQACNKPFYFQGNMKELKFDGPYHFTAAEIDMVRENPAIDGYVLYETANFTKMDQEKIIGSSSLAALLRKYKDPAWTSQN